MRHGVVLVVVVVVVVTTDYGEVYVSTPTHLTYGCQAHKAIKAKFHYAVQLASRSQTCSRAGRKLDSVMEFDRELVCDLLASWTT